MEKNYKLVYGHRSSRERFYISFVATEENASIVAIAVAKGQNADWCYYEDTKSGEGKTLWDCM